MLALKHNQIYLRSTETEYPVYKFEGHDLDDCIDFE
jgi:hypothetical protein